MNGLSIFDLIGKCCSFETIEGTFRCETVTSVSSYGIDIDGKTLFVPRTVFFDAFANDGIDVPMIKSIKVAF